MITIKNSGFFGMANFQKVVNLKSNNLTSRKDAKAQRPALRQTNLLSRQYNNSLRLCAFA
jgi:hypothetical protein